MKLLLLVALASVTTADNAAAEEERQLAAGLGTLLGALAGNQLAGTDPLTSLLAGAAGGAAGNAAGSIAGNLAGNLLSGGRARDFLEAKAKARAARCLVDSLVERAKVSLEKMDCLEKEARERDFSERTAFLEEGGRKEAKENLQ